MISNESGGITGALARMAEDLKNVRFDYVIIRGKAFDEPSKLIYTASETVRRAGMRYAVYVKAREAAEVLKKFNKMFSETGER